MFKAIVKAIVKASARVFSIIFSKLFKEGLSFVKAIFKAMVRPILCRLYFTACLRAV